MDAIEKDGYAIERGYKLTRDQQIIRAVINSIMCNELLQFSEIAKQFDLTVEEIKNIVGFERSRFNEFEQDGLIEISESEISLSPKGFMVARNIAIALDPDLKKGEAIYSKTL